MALVLWGGVGSARSLRGDVAHAFGLLRARRHWSEPILPLIASICLSATLAVGCAASSSGSSSLPVNPSGYRIIEPPESSTAYLGTAQPIYWIDNQRLLFMAVDRKLSKTEMRSGRSVVTEAEHTIHTWNVETGEVKRYRPEPLAANLCYADGFVRYVLMREGQRLVYEGPLGEERPRPETPPRVVSADHKLWTHVNPFTCREYWYLDQPRPNGGRPIPLRQDHGVLESRGWNPGRNQPDDHALTPPFGRWLHREGSTVEIAFPQEPVGLPIRYSELVQAYVFRRPESRIERGMINKMYLFFPATLTVRSLEIPGDSRWHSLHDAAVTTEGVVAASRAINVRADWDPGDAGLYLFSGPAVQEFVGFSATVERPVTGTKSARIAVERLNRGTIEHVAVSPNGCRVVAKVDPWDGTPRRIRLEVIDFCAGRR